MVKLNALFQSLKLRFSFTDYRRIVGPLIIGILLRLVLAVYTSDSGDFEVWYIAFLNMVSGLGSPYFTMYYSYPPVWAYFMLPFSSIVLPFSNPYQLGARVYLENHIYSATSPFFNILYKLPIFLAEILVGLLIYAQIKKHKNEKMAYKAFILWFFNPLVLLIGSIDGQMDALAALMVVLAFCFFMEKKYFLSGTSIAIGAMVKIFPLYLLPLYLAFLLKFVYDKHLQGKISIIKAALSNYLSTFSGLFLGIVIAIMPLLVFGSLSSAIEAVTTRGSYVASIGGFTPFIIALYLIPDAFAWFSAYGRPQMVYSVLQIAFFISALFVIFYYVFYTKRNPIHQRFLQAHIGLIVTLYLTSLVVNPQYLLWIIPFLILGYGIYGNYSRRIIILSVCAVIAQLYWVRHYFNSLIFFSNFSRFGFSIDNMLVNFLDAFGYQLMSISGFIGVLIITSLYFAKLPVKLPVKIIVEVKRSEKCEPD